MAGTLCSKAGSARQRAASRPTHPSWSLAASTSTGASWNRSMGPSGLPRPGSSCRMTCLSEDEPSRSHQPPHGKGVALWILGGACGLLCDSCGPAELSRGDADYALEVMGELALVREAHVRGD